MIIGITGPIASGKNSVAKILSKKLNYKIVNLSEIVEEEIKRRNLPLKRENYQKIGNEMRKKYGSDILVKMAVTRLNRKNGIINGIRNPGEIEYLKKRFGNNFILILVNASDDFDISRNVRFERLLKRAGPNDPKTWKEFLEIDEKDLGLGEPEYGQRVAECMEMANEIIINNSSMHELEKKVERFHQIVFIDKLNEKH